MRNNSLISLTTFGATDGQVTGSCNYVEVDGLKILVDFGMYQDGQRSQEQMIKTNMKLPNIKFDELDYVIATHPHNDHIGKIGALPLLDFNGKILTTALTSELMYINLCDSAFIMQKECQKINLKKKDSKIQPLYTQSEVDEVMSMTRGYNYNQVIKLNENVTIEFLPAGHIAGSSMVLLTYKVSEYEKKTVLFTGDTSGLKDKPFTMKPNLEKLKVNMIVSESTYGSSNKKQYDPIKQLKEQIDKTVINKQKTLLIPVFAIARSTEMIYLLREIIENDSKYSDIELFLASPMAIKANKVILNPDNFMFYDKQWHDQKDLIKWNRINYIDNFEEVKSQLINNKPKIILAASGMLQVGFSNYLAGHYLKYKGNHILLTGYSAEGTVSRVLYDGIQKSVAISGVQTPIRCEVSLLEGLSSHCSGDELVELFSQLEKKKIQKICVIHGNESSREGLRDKLEGNFKNAKVILPKKSQVIKI